MPASTRPRARASRRCASAADAPAQAARATTSTCNERRPAQRVLRPLGCFYWGAAWTLAAWCELRQDFRSFRVDRIEALRAARRALPRRARQDAGRSVPARADDVRRACEPRDGARRPVVPPGQRLRQRQHARRRCACGVQPGSDASAARQAAPASSARRRTHRRAVERLLQAHAGSSPPRSAARSAGRTAPPRPRCPGRRRPRRWPPPRPPPHGCLRTGP